MGYKACHKGKTYGVKSASGTALHTLLKSEALRGVLRKRKRFYLIRMLSHTTMFFAQRVIDTDITVV